jgi:hypothetical protein
LLTLTGGEMLSDGIKNERNLRGVMETGEYNITATFYKLDREMFVITCGWQTVFFFRGLIVETF